MARVNRRVEAKRILNEFLIEMAIEQEHRASYEAYIKRTNPVQDSNPHVLTLNNVRMSDLDFLGSNEEAEAFIKRLGGRAE